jgi:hypothetical protein
MKLGDHDKDWALHKVCGTCIEGLRSWKARKKISLSFAISMVWREPVYHTDDSYFCLVKVNGCSAKNKKDTVYPNHPSANRPVPQNDDLPVPSTTLVTQYALGQIMIIWLNMMMNFKAVQVMACHSYLVSQNLMT